MQITPKSVKFCCMTHSHAEMIAAYYTFVKMIVSLEVRISGHVTLRVAFVTNRVLAQVIICGRKLDMILAVYFGDPEEQIVLTLGKFSIFLFWSKIQQMQTTTTKNTVFEETCSGMFVSLSLLLIQYIIPVYIFLSGISLDVMVAVQLKTGLYFGNVFFFFVSLFYSFFCML